MGQHIVKILVSSFHRSGFSWQLCHTWMQLRYKITNHWAGSRSPSTDGVINNTHRVLFSIGEDSTKLTAISYTITIFRLRIFHHDAAHHYVTPSKQWRRLNIETCSYSSSWNSSCLVLGDDQLWLTNHRIESVYRRAMAAVTVSRVLRILSATIFIGKLQ